MQRFDTNQFDKFTSFIYQNFGIFLSPDKKDILQTKLLKLMVKKRIMTYDELFKRITNKELLTAFINEITVNKTDFFRENNHFDYIIENRDFITEANKRILRNNEIRVWSAGCSTGEEPYTLAIILREQFMEGIDIRILGTDLSTEVLKKAIYGSYNRNISTNINRYHLLKYFRSSGEGYKINEDIKKLVTFRLFNLMNNFPFKKSFDMIFCRNVMIYFDIETQQNLIKKFYDVLVPGGLLFIGHSESITSKDNKFRYIQPTIYIK